MKIIIDRSLSDLVENVLMFGIGKLEGPLQIIENVLVGDGNAVHRQSGRPAADGVHHTVQHVTVNFIRLSAIPEEEKIKKM